MFPFIVVVTEPGGMKALSKDPLATYMESRTACSTTESFKTTKHSWLVLKQQHLQLQRGKQNAK